MIVKIKVAKEFKWKTSAKLKNQQKNNWERGIAKAILNY